jgi:hypothetical protein
LKKKTRAYSKNFLKKNQLQSFSFLKAAILFRKPEMPISTRRKKKANSSTSLSSSEDSKSTAAGEKKIEEPKQERPVAPTTEIPRKRKSIETAATEAKQEEDPVKRLMRSQKFKLQFALPEFDLEGN